MKIIKPFFVYNDRFFTVESKTEYMKGVWRTFSHGSEAMLQDCYGYKSLSSFAHDVEIYDVLTKNWVNVPYPEEIIKKEGFITNAIMKWIKYYWVDIRDIFFDYGYRIYGKSLKILDELTFKQCCKYDENGSWLLFQCKYDVKNIKKYQRAIIKKDSDGTLLHGLLDTVDNSLLNVNLIKRHLDKKLKK